MRQRFPTGSGVLCTSVDGKEYAAKVVLYEKTHDGSPYRVHYVGWSARHDEWVSEAQLRTNREAITQQSDAWPEDGVKLKKAKNAAEFPSKKKKDVSVSAGAKVLPSSATVRSSHTEKRKKKRIDSQPSGHLNIFTQTMTMSGKRNNKGQRLVKYSPPPKSSSVVTHGKRGRPPKNRPRVPSPLIPSPLPSPPLYTSSRKTDKASGWKDVRVGAGREGKEGREERPTHPQAALASSSSQQTLRGEGGQTLAARGTKRPHRLQVLSPVRCKRERSDTDSITAELDTLSQDEGTELEDSHPPGMVSPTTAMLRIAADILADLERTGRAVRQPPPSFENTTHKAEFVGNIVKELRREERRLAEMKRRQEEEARARELTLALESLQQYLQPSGDDVDDLFDDALMGNRTVEKSSRRDTASPTHRSELASPPLEEEKEKKEEETGEAEETVDSERTTEEEEKMSVEPAHFAPVPSPATPSTSTAATPAHSGAGTPVGLSVITTGLTPPTPRASPASFTQSPPLPHRLKPNPNVPHRDSYAHIPFVGSETARVVMSHLSVGRKSSCGGTPLNTPSVRSSSSSSTAFTFPSATGRRFMMKPGYRPLAASTRVLPSFVRPSVPQQRPVIDEARYRSSASNVRRLVSSEGRGWGMMEDEEGAECISNVVAEEIVEAEPEDVRALDDVSLPSTSSYVGGVRNVKGPVTMASAMAEMRGDHAYGAPSQGPPTRARRGDTVTVPPQPVRRLLSTPFYSTKPSQQQPAQRQIFFATSTRPTTSKGAALRLAPSVRTVDTQGGHRIEPRPLRPALYMRTPQEGQRLTVGPATPRLVAPSSNGTRSGTTGNGVQMRKVAFVAQQPVHRVVMGRSSPSVATASEPSPPSLPSLPSSTPPSAAPCAPSTGQGHVSK